MLMISLNLWKDAVPFLFKRTLEMFLLKQASVLDAVLSMLEPVLELSRLISPMLSARRVGSSPMKFAKTLQKSPRGI